jgi:hypothetical protein
MRTKTLLLTAALAAAGIATSKAQVYSVNAVGYVNTALVPGFNLISNPLDNKNGNLIPDLFKNITPSIPNALVVYKFVNGAYKFAKYDDLSQSFSGNGGETQAVDPLKGEGVFVSVPASAGNLTVTFVGEVPQGTLTTKLVPGFQIVSSQVPQAGDLTSLGLKAIAQQGDVAYKWNTTTKKYDIAKYDDLVGDFDKPLNIGVGEAFFYNSKAAKDWTRTFSVNQ